MAIMKNINWAAWPKLHAGGDDKLGIEFAWPKRAQATIVLQIRRITETIQI